MTSDLPSQDDVFEPLPFDLKAIQERFEPVKVGSVVGGKYRVECEIGRGGMGTVYQATQLSMDRPVALKTLRGELLTDEVPVKRFYREARSASQLNHPHIVRVFDFGVDEAMALPFIVMEYLKGPTLSELVKESPLDETRAALLLSQIAKALVDAHTHGVVHRDLKPDNIIVVRLPEGDEHVKVVDFGLAKVWETGGKKSDVTKTGTLSGTPAFMSPEQIVGEAVDHRADLYALGCILHFLLTGTPPFKGEEVLSVILKQVNDPPPPLPDVLADGSKPSKAMRELYQRLMAKHPADRPESTTLVAKFLGAISRNDVPDSKSLEGSSGQGVDPSPRVSALITGIGRRPSNVTFFKHGKSASVLPWVIAGLMTLAAAIAVLVSSQPEQPPDIPLEVDTRGSRAATEPSGEKASASIPTAELAPTVPTPAVAPSVPTPAEATAASAAKAELVPVVREVKITSHPSGAHVYQGREMLGHTPLSVRRPPTGERLKLALRLKGYRIMEVSLDDETADDLDLSLRSEPKKKKKKKKKPRPEKKPEILLY